MKKLPIILILIFAAFFRVADITRYPPHLTWDEVSHGYNAYSIANTGSDEWGEKFPLIFRAFGDYKLPVYIYTLVPFVKLFGLSETTTRLPSALAGVISVFLIYLLIKQSFNYLNKRSDERVEEWVSLIGAFLFAASPWHLFVSRMALEANLALMFVIAGMYFLLRALKNINALPLGIFFLLISMWTYNSARVFVPGVIVLYSLFFFKDLKSKLVKDRRIALITLFVILLFSAPLLYQVILGTGGARYEKVKLLDEGLINRIIETRNSLNFPPVVSRLIANKLTFFTLEFTKNFFSYLSPTFLFFKGGDHYQFSVQNFGLFYHLDALILLSGAIFLLKQTYKNKIIRFIFVWLVLSIIPGSITRDAPHVLRSLFVLPVFTLIMAYGIYFIFENTKNKINTKLVVIIIFVMYSYLFARYMKDYIAYTKEYALSWQYGYRDAVAFVKDNYSEYDHIIMTKKYGEPHEFVLFYTPWNPTSYRNDSNLERYFQSGWFWVDSFDKYVFVNDWQIPEGNEFVTELGNIYDCTDIKCLLVTSPGNAPNEWKKINEIALPNGGAVFEMYEK